MAKRRRSGSYSKAHVLILVVVLAVGCMLLYSAIVLRDYNIVVDNGLELEAKVPVPTCPGFTINNQTPKKLLLTARVPSGCDKIEYRVSRFENMLFAKTYGTANGQKELGMLSPGKTYYVQARVYKRNPSGRMVFGKWSQTKMSVVKEPPN